MRAVLAGEVGRQTIGFYGKMGFHEKWTTILNHGNGLPPSSSLFMHELAIRSCFSGEGRSDAVGKCVSVSKGEGEREKGRDRGKERISRR